MSASREGPASSVGFLKRGSPVTLPREELTEQVRFAESALAGNRRWPVVKALVNSLDKDECIPIPGARFREVRLVVTQKGVCFLVRDTDVSGRWGDRKVPLVGKDSATWLVIEGGGIENLHEQLSHLAKERGIPGDFSSPANQRLLAEAASSQPLTCLNGLTVPPDSGRAPGASGSAGVVNDIWPHGLVTPLGKILGRKSPTRAWADLIGELKQPGWVSQLEGLENPQAKEHPRVRPASREDFIQQAISLGDCVYLKPEEGRQGEGLLRIEKRVDGGFAHSTDSASTALALLNITERSGKGHLEPGARERVQRENASSYRLAQKRGGLYYPRAHLDISFSSKEELTQFLQQVSLENYMAEEAIDIARTNGKMVEFRIIFSKGEKFELKGHYAKLSDAKVTGNILGGYGEETRKALRELVKSYCPHQRNIEEEVERYFEQLIVLSERFVANTLSLHRHVWDLSEASKQTVMERALPRTIYDQFAVNDEIDERRNWIQVRVHREKMNCISIDIVPVWNKDKLEFDFYLMEGWAGETHNTVGKSGLERANPELHRNFQSLR